MLDNGEAFWMIYLCVCELQLKFSNCETKLVCCDFIIPWEGKYILILSSFIVQIVHYIIIRLVPWGIVQISTWLVVRGWLHWLNVTYKLSTGWFWSRFQFFPVHLFYPSGLDLICTLLLRKSWVCWSMWFILERFICYYWCWDFFCEISIPIELLHFALVGGWI